jgi:putative ABC transport system permease protein
MLFFENIKLALIAIKSNKMRSFLTMLGIIIGTSSVIAIASIGTGAKSLLDREFSAFGKNNAYLFANNSADMSGGASDIYFTPDDITALRDRFPNELSYASLSLSGSAEVTIGRIKGRFTLKSTGGNYDRFSPINIIHGRMLTEDDVKNARPFTVISEKAATKFFGRSNVLGQTVSLTLDSNPMDLTIMGVYRETPSIFSAISGASGYTAYLPYTIWGRNVNSPLLDLYISAGRDIPSTLRHIASYIEAYKRKPAGFYSIESVESQQSSMNKILSAMSIAIGAIAAISLLVGGIGIMNIMLVSVTERTREIGIRKSLGAKTSDIMLQFLVESMIVSAVGGLLGASLGIAIASAGLNYAKIKLVVDFRVVLLAVGFSALVGMFFGLFPAKKAANLDPIEALRYE